MNLNKKNIVLLGMMGSGKSTIGYLLSKSINLKLLDVDRIIEKKRSEIDNVLEELLDRYGPCPSQLYKNLKFIFLLATINYFSIKSIITLLSKKIYSRLLLYINILLVSTKPANNHLLLSYTLCTQRNKIFFCYCLINLY